MTKWFASLLVGAAVCTVGTIASAQDAGVPPVEEVPPPPAEDSVVEDDDDETDDDEDVSDAGTGGTGDDEAVAVANTGIRGRIVDAQTGEGLPDAIVIAEGNARENAVTNQTGGYVLVVPQGRYSVLSYTELYHGARMRDVRVRFGRFTDLTLTLEPMDADAVAEEVEVVYRPDTSSAAAQDQLRAAAAGIGEGLGARQMSQSGASDAGSAARNVAGVTLEGTNLNIRGLGGAYTTVLLNGLPIPSVDPDLPSVDLDLFPTSVIDDLFISKAFLPNLPANFAGGVLDIRTVRFPRQFTFEASVNGSLNTMTSFQDRLTYDGGRLDWLGFDDGTRALPDGLPNELVRLPDRGVQSAFQTQADVDAAARLFPNVWEYERSATPPSFGLGLTMGDAVDLGEHRRFGYLITAGYGLAFQRQTGFVRNARFADGGTSELIPFTDYQTEAGSDTAELVGLATGSLELGQDDTITLLTMYNRSSTDSTEVYRGFDSERVGDIERWQMRYLTRSLWLSQLHGDHRQMFGSRARFRWSGYAGLGERDEPDRRTVTYGPIAGGPDQWLATSNSGARYYSFLDQLDVGGTADVRFPLWSEAWGTIGAMTYTSGRDFTIRRFRMLGYPGTTSADFTQQPEDLFDADSIGTETTILELTRLVDGYDSRRTYGAGFLMLETPIVSQISLTLGARLEVFEQDLTPTNPFGTEVIGIEDMLVDRVDVDVLPGSGSRSELKRAA